MRDAHLILAWALIIGNGLVGAWCGAADRWPTLRSQVLWVAVVVAQLLAFAQAVVGALWSQQEGVELNDMHALYGFSAIVAVAIMYSYRNSGFLKGKELLLYAGGSLFIMGLGLRNLVL